MAIKKKSKPAKKAKKAKKSKPASRKKASSSRRPLAKKSAKKAVARKKKKKAVSSRKSPQRSTEQIAASEERSTRFRSGSQSGDLQGLRTREIASSESVDELVEEGNAFEADVVAGVERADDEDEGEVRTHEVSEDDVPEEYLDKD